ncbi:hypothetical protein PhiCrAssBcn14_90 [Bacteroides phage PhiCrAssBcn14]|nr:hypothetical protein PhiCrAssBcn14_90 [Bacteroides phage PhiCrAssBcn14]WCF58542.1 hypothetical protein PhiCrAssBcn15_52 [Bacteroides phage PhiCrAssBcn15]WCF58783.1 hypothetical protein PhiCrAssBcn18_77 [Bacteroides phage PhiCrAssBcn18]WCI99955.1 hypothetical protein PhiCrAssBcn16_106 [Bacteroides phage PhiCrAssBcn16]
MKQPNYFNRTPEELQQEIEAARKLSKYTCTNCGRDYEAAYNIKPIKPIDPEEWSNNLWCQGDIPDEFKEEFSDNCVQITKEEYLKGISNETD